MSSVNFKIHNSIPTPVFEKGLKDASLDKLEVIKFVADVPNSLAASTVRNIYRLMPGQIITNAFATVTDNIELTVAGTVNISVANTATDAGNDLLVSGSLTTLPVGTNLGFRAAKVCNEFVNIRTSTGNVGATGGGKVVVTLFIVNP